MKTTKLILCILLLAGTTTVASARKHSDVSVLSVKRDIFYFKVCSSLVGGRIDVFSSNGELLASSEISSRKTIIDFHFANQGSFIIKITKDNKELNFDYKKSSPSPLSENETEHHITITQ